MKIAVFGDIHGNGQAFECFLNSIIGNDIDYIFFTGDIMGYYYDQIYIIEKLKALNSLISVIGNHDYMYLKNKEYDDVKKLSIKYGQSYVELMNNTMVQNYFNNIPNYIDIVINSKRIIMFHGSLEDNINGRIYPDSYEKFQEIIDVDYVLFGHTHYRTFKKCGKTNWINPGSLGQPRDGKGSGYCIIDLLNNQIEFKSVLYDKNFLINQVRDKDPENKYLIDVLYREG